MTVRPDKLVQLTPLDAAEKPKYGLADVATTLAYRYESPKYAASLVVERTRPRLTARTFSFFRVEPDALSCHYELIYTVEEARTQRLALLLPKDTPASVSIAALDGVKLKEFSSEIGGRTAPLERAAGRGPARAGPPGGRFPAAVALAGAEGFCAADRGGRRRGLSVGPGGRRGLRGTGSAGRHGRPAPVDVGELAEADYQPGRRLLGAFGFVGDPPAVKIDVLRHPGYRIYPAIVEQCELDTNLSPDGQSQTQARFKLRTKAVYLQVKLPPEAELWSAELDGVPLKPQREGDSVLIDVPAGTANAAQTLQIVYAAPVERGGAARHGRRARSQAVAAREQGKEAVEVPLADLVWRLHLPSGYEVVRAGGTVVTDELKRPLPAAVEVAGILYYLTGGISGPLPLSARPCSPPAKQPAGVAAVDNLSESGGACNNGLAT